MNTGGKVRAPLCYYVRSESGTVGSLPDGNGSFVELVPPPPEKVEIVTERLTEEGEAIMRHVLRRTIRRILLDALG